MMQIATKEDYQALNNKLDHVLTVLEDIKSDRTVILTTEQIYERLHLSYRSFQRRVPILKKFGLFKDGRGYRMKESDLNKYIESL